MNQNQRRVAMKEIIVTGMNEEDFVRFGKKDGKKCYLCKREEGEESIIFNETEDCFKNHEIELHTYEVLVKDITFKYFVCSDCFILIRGIEGTNIFSETVKDQTNNNN